MNLSKNQGRKRYLVTGGSGFIGSALVKRLVNEGLYVRVLDSNLRGVKSRFDDIRSKIDFVEADIRDSAAVRNACSGVDSVLHLAFVNGTEYFYQMPELVLDIGVKGMVNVLDGCRAENVKELVLASSSEVYQSPPVVPTPESVRLVVPDPMNPRYSYGGGKIISELMTINYGKKYFDRVMIFRPHNVYGPDMGWEHVIPQFVVRMKTICEEQAADTVDFPIQGTGQETRAFVYIDDFIEGLMIMLEKGEHLHTYNIGTMDEVSIQEVAGCVGEFFGKKVNVVADRKTAAGGTSRRCPDIAKIAALGYRPGVGLADGVRTTAEWYVQNLDKQKKISTEQEAS